MPTGRYEVYLITAPGFWYVGSTTRGAAVRFREHMTRPSASCARLLTAKVQELGSSVFESTVLEVGVGSPTEAEARWYDLYLANDARQTLNGCRPGGWPNITPEGRARLSAKHRGKVITAETRAKISAAKRGRTPTAEQRARQSAGLVGHQTSVETRSKISAALMGRPKSSAARTAMSTAKTGTRWSAARRAAQPQLRITHCPQGHPYDESNTYRVGGSRICRACRNEIRRKYRQKQKELAA